MRTAVRRLSCVLLCLGMAGCVSRGEIEELKNNQDELKKNQDELKKNQQKILEKLDAIAKRIVQPKRQRPGRPDPKVVYSFPAGESPFKGSKDAWVTIVEVSEFQ